MASVSRLDILSTVAALPWSRWTYKQDEDRSVHWADGRGLLRDVRARRGRSAHCAGRPGRRRPRRDQGTPGRGRRARRAHRSNWSSACSRSRRGSRSPDPASRRGSPRRPVPCIFLDARRSATGALSAALSPAPVAPDNSDPKILDFIEIELRVNFVPHANNPSQFQSDFLLPGRAPMSRGGTACRVFDGRHYVQSAFL